MIYEKSSGYFNKAVLITLLISSFYPLSLFGQSISITRDQWDGYANKMREIGRELNFSSFQAERIGDTNAIYITGLVHNRNEDVGVSSFRMQCEIHGRDVLIYSGYAYVYEESPILPGNIKRVVFNLSPRDGDYVRSPMARDVNYNYYLRPGIPSSEEDRRTSRSSGGPFSEVSYYRPSNISVDCKDVFAEKISSI